MMRDIYLGVRLPFDTAEDQEDSEDYLMWLLGTISRLNRLYLRRHPHTQPLYESGVRYVPPDQLSAPALKREDLRDLFGVLKRMGQPPETALMVYRVCKGAEVFLDIPSLYQRGAGDCNELVPVRVAELWRAGIGASPYLTKERNARGGWTYHALVLWPDGSSEDPSLILGMGGEARAADRKEEIRKNKERWDNHLAAAAYLIAAEGADPAAAAKQVDSLGLVPRDGVFRLAPKVTP